MKAPAMVTWIISPLWLATVILAGVIAAALLTAAFGDRQ